jgi:hypothetical protein
LLGTDVESKWFQNWSWRLQRSDGGAFWEGFEHDVDVFGCSVLELMNAHAQPVETKSSELPLPIGLVYVTDSEPGIIRRKRGKGLPIKPRGARALPPLTESG